MTTTTAAALHLLPPPFPAITIHTAQHSPPPLLLRRPRPLHLVADQPNPILPTTGGGSTTTSHVLRIMDALNLPVSEDVYTALLTDSPTSSDAADILRHMAIDSHRPGTLLSNRLLLTFVAAGSLDLAGEVFEEMPKRDAVSWAAMMFGLVDAGRHRDAMLLLAEMTAEKCLPTAMILVAAVRACIGAKDLCFGEQLHCWAMKHGFTRDLFMSSTLVHFYGKMKCSKSARGVFDEMRRRNAVAWTVLIDGCGNAGEFEEAVWLFQEMGKVGKKNEFTFSSVLVACGDAGDGGFHGRQIHADAIKLGVEFDPVVQSSLLGMYTKVGLLEDASMVLRLMAMEGRLGFKAVKSFFMR